MTWWLPEWPALTGEFERMDREQLKPLPYEFGECLKCRSLQADNEAMERQSRIAVKAYEDTITELRQRIAILEYNRDARIDRQGGFNTTNVGE